MTTTPTQKRAAAAVEYWRRRGHHQAAREVLLGLPPADQSVVVSMTDRMHSYAAHSDAQLRTEMHDLAAQGAALQVEHKTLPGSITTVDGAQVKAPGDLEPAPLDVAPGTFAGVLGHADLLDYNGGRLDRKALERAAGEVEPGLLIKDRHDGEPVAEVVTAWMHGPELWIEAFWMDTPASVTVRDRVAKSLREGTREGLSLELAGLVEVPGADGWPVARAMRIEGGAIVARPANDGCRIMASDDLEGVRVNV
jgi:hypothetical protein